MTVLCYGTGSADSECLSAVARSATWENIRPLAGDSACLSAIAPSGVPVVLAEEKANMHFIGYARQPWDNRSGEALIRSTGPRPTRYPRLVIDTFGSGATGSAAGSPGSDDGVVTFRPLAPDDVALLQAWLSEPHVARWWAYETSSEALEREFGPAMRGEEPAEYRVAELDDVPVGLVQRCRWHDYPEYVDEVAEILTIPSGAVWIDYLIGRPTQIGRGLGTRMISAAVAEVWRRYPDAPAVIVPVVAANQASCRALERAGMRRAASGDLPPDNEVDPPLHYVYRLDRPPRTPSAPQLTDSSH